MRCWGLRTIVDNRRALTLLSTVLHALDTTIAVVLVAPDRFNDPTVEQIAQRHFPALAIMVVNRDESGQLRGRASFKWDRFLGELQARDQLGQVTWSELPAIQEPSIPF